ncbi:MAG: hypothetical protein ACXWRZ_06115, partial [Bdellovibrio sp.]
FAEEENPFKNLDYPELQVAPRATERLIQMAQMEESYGPLNQWTMITSGILTAFAGFRNKDQYKVDNPSDSEKRDTDLANNTAIGVGVATVAVGSYLSFRKPIYSGFMDIKKVSAKDRRGDLTRERMAEEVMENTANIQRTINNFAVFSNFAASIYMTSYASQNNRVCGYIAAAASLLPWVFPNMYELNYNKHIEYKRKIYAPLVWVDVGADKYSQVNLNWSF